MKILLCGALAAAFSLPYASTAPATPPAGAWKVDPVHSSVVFKVKHAGASWFYGTFGEISGSFLLDGDKLADSEVKVTIPAASVASRDDKRDQHLRGPDFFDAKQFPDITFESTQVARAGEAFVVQGDLTLRGITKSIQVRVEKTGEGEFYGKRVGYETTFSIQRSDFGMEYGLAENALGDEVVLTIAIEGVQPEAGK
ncbi:MAG: YceI family protein [Planctomycetota bacterium]